MGSWHPLCIISREVPQSVVKLSRVELKISGLVSMTPSLASAKFAVQIRNPLLGEGGLRKFCRGTGLEYIQKLLGYRQVGIRGRLWDTGMRPIDFAYNFNSTKYGRDPGVGMYLSG